MKTQKNWRTGLDPVSASALVSLFQWCARKLEYEKFLGLSGPTHISAAFGIHIHRMAYLFFKKRVLRDGTTKIGFQVKDAFVRYGAGLWHAILEGRCGPRGYGTPACEMQPYTVPQREAYRDLLYSTLNIFWMRNVAFKDDPARFPITEKKIGNIKIKGKFFLHTVGGILDRIQPVPETQNEGIVDYKTHERATSVTALQQDIQLLMYHVLYYLWRGMHPAYIRVEYLRYGKVIDVPFDRSTTGIERRIAALADILDRYKGMLVAVMSPKEAQLVLPPSVEVYRQSKRFPKNPGDPQCYLCPFKERCLNDHEEESYAQRLELERLIEAVRGGFPIQMPLDIGEIRDTSRYWTKKRLFTAALFKEKI